MSGRLKLESFETEGDTLDQVVLDPEALEETKLVAFEKGYTAGWDDAIAAQNSETTRLHLDLGKNLLALSVTYEEARTHLLKSLRPLLVEMTTKVLPAIARDSLPRIVLEQLQEVAEDRVSAPICIVANPAVLGQVKEILAAQTSLPFVFSGEPTLPEGQVYLRLEHQEVQIDLDGVIARIEAAVNTYFSNSIGAQDGNQ